ncbi:hypothetical protein A2Y85_08435 [candidate division WOR-3 bacterium RBG_13_43_14]|uniref:HEAT repeat domain-containing protein n=1 Tax=candidate division WOR-3 bacterium RBG_13_43_14 TaxID=1802590 RepID=A0A1F4UE64_UNCW3|nr:MAG: hypothetical protein A2Y85_08435 [candidate division WOR-3 bacterium RBG_13_43_14]
MGELSQAFCIDFIKQMGIGINITRTYPKGHPSLMPIVKRLHLLLKEVPIEQETISMVIVEDVIMIESERFDSRRLPIVKSLVNRFNQMDVKSITFSVNSDEDDIKEFFTAMAASPADIADYGDIVSLVRARGITNVQINKFRVGVISSDNAGVSMNWNQFLDSLTMGSGAGAISDEDRVQDLSRFLVGIGLAGTESENVQTNRIVGGLEKLALLIADQFGEQRWDEYSVVFSRMLAALSPTIKKNIVRYKIENKKLAVLFKSLVPTMSDEDLIDIITNKAKEKTPTLEQDTVDILKNVTGSRLPGILSSLRVNVPELDFEKIAGRLMSEMKTTGGERVADKFMSKNLENEIRSIFPRLRDVDTNERSKALEELLVYAKKISESKNDELLKLLIDRLDTMADAETEISLFSRIIGSMTNIYIDLKKNMRDDIVQFLSRKFGKHMLRKDATLLDRKRIVIRAISEMKDENYITDLVSLLWDPGTFTEAREAMVSLADLASPLLLSTLKETDDRAVRMKIIDVLINIGEKAIPEIEKLLTSDDWFVRRNAVFLLGELKASSSIEKLAALIDDPEPKVTLDCFESLIKISGDDAKVYIKKAINSESRLVVLAAMRFLDRDDAREKLPVIASWLKSKRTLPEAKEEDFRRRVIEVIGMHGDDSMVDVLARLLQEGALIKGHLLQPTKISALNALASINTEKAINIITQATRNRDSAVAGTAEEILRRLSSKRDVQ